MSEAARAGWLPPISVILACGPTDGSKRVRAGCRLAGRALAVHSCAIASEKCHSRPARFYDCAWMSAIEVIVRPRPETAPSSALASLHGLFDVIVDGINVTARLGEGQALALLCDLGFLVSGLARGKRDRGTLQL